VGKIITDDDEKYTVAGVVKDFLFNDMYGKPDPVIFFNQPSRTGNMLVRIKEDKDLQQALTKIGSVMDKDNPGYPFEYKFMDAEFDNIFRSEMMVSRLSRLFAGLTILISCLGLFGLAAYTAERRTKEIGIRKVLGATVQNVLFLLSADFLLLVFIAFIIAFPLAWWAMHSWLQDFAYRININWGIFLAAGAAAILIALVTVSFQAIKAALSNPVRSLRTE
ncbi:MAG TPA: FtsX-like permease family protein, partial [Ferruginibacter sp.]|nr:FtsX-like permease family protein [Ferruginibacter sp.]